MQKGEKEYRIGSIVEDRDDMLVGFAAIISFRS